MIHVYASIAYRCRIKRTRNRRAKETIVLSTNQYSYAEIIQQIEKNKGEKNIQLYHPNFGFSV